MVTEARRCEVDRCNKFALSIKKSNSHHRWTHSCERKTSEDSVCRHSKQTYTVWQCKPHYYDSIRSEPMPKFMKKLMDL